MNIAVIILAAALVGAVAVVAVLWSKLTAVKIENARLNERCLAADSMMARHKADLEQANADLRNVFATRFSSACCKFREPEAAEYKQPFLKSLRR